MTRASSVVQGLTLLAHRGLVGGWVRDGASDPLDDRWVISVGTDNHRFTTGEVEAFLAGALLALSRYPPTTGGSFN